MAHEKHRSRRKRRHPSIRLGLCCLTGITGMAFAQSVQAIDDDATLETIIVTAERRVSNLQDTPISVVALSGDSLSERDITQVSEALRSVPSVSMAQTAKGGQVYIRGIGGALDAQIGNPAVNLNFDGRYQGQATPVFASLFDIDRIEVLRGPQGTLYGRNATAGSINIISKDPADAFEAKASVTLGNYSAKRLEGVINLPVSDGFKVRAAIISDEHDGYFSNGYGNNDTLGGRIKALWEINRDAQLMITIDSYEINGLQGTVHAPVYILDPSWKASDPAEGYSHGRSWSVAADLNMELAFGALTLSASHQDFSLDYYRWFAANIGDQESTDKQTIVEARLTSLPGSDIEWIAGAFLLEGKKTDLVYAPSRNTTQDYPQLDPSSLGLFANLRYPLNDALSLYGGVRYTSDEQQNKGRAYAGAPGSDTTTPYFSPSGSWSNTDYRIGFEYNLGNSSMLYLTHATGYKAGGIYQGDAPNTYEPEELSSFSIGAKNRFLDNKLQLNAEIFYYDYENFQVQTIGVLNPITSPPAFGLVIYNAADAKITGGEVELVWKLSTNDQIDLSLTALDAQFGDDFIVTSAFGPPADYSSYPMPQSPDLAISAAWEHYWQLDADAEIKLRLDSKWSDGYWPEYSQYPDSYQDSYLLSNASIQYSKGAQDWSLRFHVKNIENKPVIESAFRVPGAPVTLQLNQPRTYGATFVKHFH